LLEDAQFVRLAHKKFTSAWVTKFEECLKAAAKVGELHETPVRRDLSAWFVHHIAFALMLHLHPKVPAVDYKVSKDVLVEQAVRCSFRPTQEIRHDKKPSPFDLPFSHSDPAYRIPRRRLRQKAGGGFRTAAGACNRRYRGHSGCSRVSRRHRQVCRPRSGFYPAAGFLTYRADLFHGMRRLESWSGAFYHRPTDFSCSTQCGGGKPRLYNIGYGSGHDIYYRGH